MSENTLTSAVELAPASATTSKPDQQRLAVGAHSHDAAAFSSCSCRFGPIDCFGKVQTQFVNPLVQRNVVAKLTLPARAIESRIERARDVLVRAFNRGPAVEPVVGAPKLVRMIDETPVQLPPECVFLFHSAGPSPKSFDATAKGVDSTFGCALLPLPRNAPGKPERQHHEPGPLRQSTTSVGQTQ